VFFEVMTSSSPPGPAARHDDGVTPAEPSSRLSGEHVAESFDDDLAWIVSKYVERTGALGGVLSVHHQDGRPADLLFSYGVAAGQGLLKAAVEQAASAMWKDRRRGDALPASNWGTVRGTHGEHRALSMPLAADGHHRIVLTALYDTDDSLSTEAILYPATKLQPVLAGYFKLWLLNRSQRRRLDGLASALNFTDVAIFLLDSSANLLFTNHAARGLLDDVDGLRRIGSTVGATDVSDAVKLRIAIEHVIATHGDEPDSAGFSPIVPLRRGDDRRALIASVMPVEKPPRTPADPTVVLYVFSPDINVGLLLLPICQIYGLSPAETRLVGLLAEGLSANEAAARMRVKIPTVRTYLKQIFAKTETARQSDLIRLMMGSLVRTRPQQEQRII
jgi:DNA-binding CsgD family transcriptional regulator